MLNSDVYDILILYLMCIPYTFSEILQYLVLSFILAGVEDFYFI
nr:MAG TPA: hypothetical protein [Caudoviricetes sp.]